MADQGETKSVYVLVAQSFNLAATMSFIDPLRVYNYLYARRYRWSFHAQTEGLVQASNGGLLQCLALPEERPDYLVVSTSWSPETLASAEILATLRRWHRANTRLVTLDTGAFVLGHAGLLGSGQATVHPEHRTALRELYPRLTVVDDPWVEDKIALFCAGGSAAVDCALALVEADHGDGCSRTISRYLLHNTCGEPTNRAVEPSLFSRAEDLMSANIETPLPIPEIAQHLNVSQKQLERCFKVVAGSTPVAHYHFIRIDCARELVTQTELTFTEIAVACGFSSLQHLSRDYKAAFGFNPRDHRKVGGVAYELRQ